MVNLSLGGSQWSETERDAIDAVLAAGKVVVASAGNTGDRIPQYPAVLPGRGLGRGHRRRRRDRRLLLLRQGRRGRPRRLRGRGRGPRLRPGPRLPRRRRRRGGLQQRHLVRRPDRLRRARPGRQPHPAGGPAGAGSQRRRATTRAAPATPSSGRTGWSTPGRSWPPTTRRPPALVLETTGGAGRHRIGSGDGQLPAPRHHLCRLRLPGRRRGGRQPGHGQLRRRRRRHRRLRGRRRRRRHLQGHPGQRRRWSRASRRSSPPPPSTGRRRPARCRCWRWPPTTRRPGSTWPTWPTTAPGGGWTASTATTWTTSTPSPSAGATGST